MDRQHDHIESIFKSYTFSNGPEVYEASFILERMRETM